MTGKELPATLPLEYVPPSLRSHVLPPVPEPIAADPVFAPSSVSKPATPLMEFLPVSFTPSAQAPVASFGNNYSF